MKAALIVLALLVPRAASAFSDPALFAAPAAEGGGNGRFFTGSPADGHGCGVCHRGGVAPVLEISGLPDVYVRGSRSDVSITWRDPESSHAIQLELIADGAHPGVELPDPLPASARCEQQAEGAPAITTTDLGARRIIGLEDCGASEVRFSFVAPDAPRLVFALAAVRSDGSATSEGDGVIELRRTLVDRPQSGGCSAARDGGWLIGVLVLVCLRRRRAAVLGATLALGACFSPRFDADELREGDQRPSDLFGPDGGTRPVCTTPDPSPLTALHVRVRTTPAGGRFRPRNVGAIWIERADGTFVKTLERWGITRAKWLTRWIAASSSDVTDAITGATLVSHVTHEPTWDLTGLDACEIAAGDYRVVFELTDKSGTGVSHEVPFTKDQVPATLTFPDHPSFHDLQLLLE